MDIRSQLFRVVVATVGSMILGSLWYSPLLFSGLWLRLIGKTSDEIREQGGMIKGIVTSTIGGLITAYVLALVIKATGSTSLVDGLLVALWIWLGFVATREVVTRLVAPLVRLLDSVFPAVRRARRDALAGFLIRLGLDESKTGHGLH